MACTAERYDEARERFAHIDYKSLSPRHQQQYDIRMGYICFQQENYDEALTYLRRIPSPSEYADHALYYTSYIAYVRNENETAKSGFTRLLKSDSYGDLAPFYLLQIEFNEGNYSYVTSLGEQLVERASGDRKLELQRVVAESWFHLGEYDRCLRWLESYEQAGGNMDRNENYIKGYSLYRLARYGEATTCLQQVCGADDALTQNASYHLADCYVRIGDKQHAMQSFAMAANETYDSDIAEDALFNYGKLQYELGGGVFNEAIHILNKYVEQYPTSDRATTAKELLIAAYYNSKNYDSAYEAIKEYPNPDNDMKAALQKIAYFRGLEAYERGDLEVASQSLSESAQANISPKYTALAQFWQGEIAYAQGDEQRATALYQAYLKQAPRSESEYAMAQYNLGYCYFNQNDMSNAYNAFARFNMLYTTRDSYKADALNREADTHYALRQFTSALEGYEKASSIGTIEHYYADYQRAITLGILERQSQKVEALKSIITIDKGDYVDDATYELGRTYITSEQYAEGAQVLAKFVEEYPHSPLYTSALSDLGLAYLNLGRTADSKRCYEQVVEYAPRSIATRNAMQGIRDIYVASGDVDGYFAYAEKSGVECDTSAVARDSLSFASARKIYLSGAQSDAEKSLKSYLKSYPKGYYADDALYYLSDCQIQLGEKTQAIETLSTLTERPAGQYTLTALKQLSKLSYESGQYAEAAKAYRSLYDAVTSADDRAAAALGYLRSTLREGNQAQSVKVAEEVETWADAGQTTLREARYLRATALRQAGDTAKALPLYKQLSTEVKSKEGAEAAYRVIEITWNAGDGTTAEKLISELSQKNSPQAYWVAKAYIVWGDIFLSRNDTFQARATYQSIVDGYSPANDGIVAEAKSRIEKLKK
jgi:TolA-binding protein